MPVTVITLKKSTPSLRGDLSKWMQEIATGVYIGNFNARIREQLWQRVIQNVGKGEATLSYACRNEIGYDFKTHNTDREVVYFDGLPLFNLPVSNVADQNGIKLGFSNASKFHRVKHKKMASNLNYRLHRPYMVIDIETEGLDSKKHAIIEIAAVLVEADKLTMFSSLINTGRSLNEEIIDLTGITNQCLIENGKPIEEVLLEFLDFLGDQLVVGYGVAFDIEFLNKALEKMGKSAISNQIVDLKRLVKKENMFLANYKLETVLNAYGIDKKVPHRALEDSKLIYELSTKVNLFLKMVEEKA